MKRDRHREAAQQTLGRPGRLISLSKSGYGERFPDNLAVFNANVCVAATKVWHGDLDLSTSDEARLVELAVVLGEPVYVLYEGDGRFQHEQEPLLGRAVYSTTANHTRFQHDFIERTREGRLQRRPPLRQRRKRLVLTYGRPRLLHFWRVDIRRGSERGPTALRFLLVYIGRGSHGGPSKPHSPLLVLGVVRERRPRAFSLEWTWYPSAKRHAPWPLLHLRLQLRRGPLRPHLVLRVHPGFAYEFRLGLALGRDRYGRWR